MSTLITEAGFNLLLLIDVIVTCSESVHYSNCKKFFTNGNDTDDGMVFSIFKDLIYAV